MRLPRQGVIVSLILERAFYSSAIGEMKLNATWCNNVTETNHLPHNQIEVGLAPMVLGIIFIYRSLAIESPYNTQTIQYIN